MQILLMVAILAYICTKCIHGCFFFGLGYMMDRLLPGECIAQFPKYAIEWVYCSAPNIVFFAVGNGKVLIITKEKKMVSTEGSVFIYCFIFSFYWLKEMGLKERRQKQFQGLIDLSIITISIRQTIFLSSENLYHCLTCRTWKQHESNIKKS